ncbi:DivIVA domain-containing protein [Fibrella sp. WM1]|uniref:DivIVA domain-containing protein n=1 Tax=Fibrella musci TaxID=3242485 RepID=UPI003520F1DD
MKITPIEIRQHTFEKSLRGYRVDEVDAFLASLSQEWERVVGESKMLKMQLELAEKELNKLKEIELTLFRTLKNAEDNSSHIAEQANRQAEQYMAEARQKADEQLVAAKKKSAVMIQDAENQSRYVRETLSVELKSLEQDFKAMERYKDNLMVQIRALATNAMESVDRFEKKFAKQQAKQKFDELVGESETTGSQPTEPQLTAPEEPVAEQQAATEPEPETPVANTAETVESEAPAEEKSAEPAVYNLPADAEVPADLPEATNAPNSPDEPMAVAGAEASAQSHTEEPTYEQPREEPEQPVQQQAESAEKKSGGSFFDQI